MNSKIGEIREKLDIIKIDKEEPVINAAEKVEALKQLMPLAIKLLGPKIIISSTIVTILGNKCA